MYMRGFLFSLSGWTFRSNLSLFSVEFREKKLLVSSEDYGRDLTGVQNLRKKHKRLEAELAAHEPAIQVNASPHDISLLAAPFLLVQEIKASSSFAGPQTMHMRKAGDVPITVFLCRVFWTQVRSFQMTTQLERRRYSRDWLSLWITGKS